MSSNEQYTFLNESKFTFFWSGPFSQWYHSKFILDGHTFANAEQYMMWSKAKLFDDHKRADIILKTTNPRTCKAEGRKVVGFDQEIWNQHREAIVHKGNMAKFSQNPHLWNKLKNTKGTTLVEASPSDTIWGIGLRANDPRAMDRKTWRGQNLLGEILTRVRNKLLSRKTN